MSKGVANVKIWYIGKTEGDVLCAELYKCCVPLIKVVTLAALVDYRSYPLYLALCLEHSIV